MLTNRERAELERLRRDLANGRISPNAHGLAVQRIAELERKDAADVVMGRWSNDA